MRLTNIYTKIGDKGTTMLASGEKVPKTDARIEAYGTVDELNAFVGLLRDELISHKGIFDDVVNQLLVIQNELFDIGGELSTPAKVLDPNIQQVVGQVNIERLEREIDNHNAKLKPLENFVLPGGCKANSAAHVARTVCRRAERRVLAFSGHAECRSEPRIFLNRLSDWFFIICRVIPDRLSLPELQWQQTKK